MKKLTEFERGFFTATISIKLILILFAIVLLVGTVSAFEFDNVKDYDEDKREYLVKNAFGLGEDIARIKLTSSLNQLVPRGYQKVAEIEVENYDDYINVFNDMEFKNLRKNGEIFTRDFDYKYKTIIQIPNYKTICDKGFSGNGTIININCRQEQIGFKNKIVWEDINKVEGLLRGNITIGIFTDVKKGDRVEWIPKLFGERLTEWAQWTESLNVDLISYYKFEETSGVVVDSIGLNNGTNNGATRGVNGIIGNGFNFTDTNYVNTSGPTKPSNVSFTFNGWFLPKDTTSGPGTLWSAEAGTYQHFMLYSPSGNFLRFLSRTTSNNNVDNNVGVGSLTGWHMFTGVAEVNSTGFTSRLYLDGSNVGNITSILILEEFDAIHEFGRTFFEQENHLNGTLDEIGIWNRTLNESEIIDLYNGGLGITHRTFFGPTTTLNSPINAFNTTSQTINFNGTITSVDGVTNVTLFIDGILNETNSSGINDTDYLFTKIISDGNHNWTYESCNSNGCVTAITRTFSIDSTFPTIIVTFPNETIDFHLINTNLFVNWTVSDSNLDTCILEYEESNTTVTCLDNQTTINITNSINRSLIFYVNDTFGNLNSSSVSWNYRLFLNSETFTASILEGASSTFEVNLTTNGISITLANLSYNNTENIGSISQTGNQFVMSELIISSSVTTDTNISFFWNLTMADDFFFALDSQFQLVQALSIDNCSTNTNLILNYTLRDEETQAILVGATENTTMDVDVTIFTSDKSTEILNFSTSYNQTNPAQVCLNINLTTEQYQLDATNKYVSSLREIEYHNIQGLNLTNSSIPQNINLLDLLSTDSTEFQITFKDSNFVVVENALINVNRQYVAEGLFKTVEIPKTDSNGQTVVHLVEKDIVYNFIVIKDGVILGTFNNLIAFCEDVVIGSCFITLNALQTNIAIFDYDSIIGLAFSFSYNDTSRVLSFPFTTTDGSVKNVTLRSVKLDRLGNTSVCFETLISSSGTILCSVPASIGNETIIVSIFVDGNIKITNYISAGQDFDIGNTGYFLLLILLIFMVTMLIESKAGVIIGTLTAFISGALFSWIQGGILGVGSLMVWMIIAGGILLWKLNVDNQT